MDNPDTCQLIEAALLSADRPLRTQELARLCDADGDAVQAALEQLGQSCAGRALELVQVAGGWRMQVRAQMTPRLLPLWQERPAKYSRALLETLAIIAYRQPTTRGEIDEVRGVSSSNVHIKTLLERGWIKASGQRDTPGRPAEYSTTTQFLDYFGLRSLKQLPQIAQIKAMVEEQSATAEHAAKGRRQDAAEDGAQDNAPGDAPAAGRQ